MPAMHVPSSSSPSDSVNPVERKPGSMQTITAVQPYFSRPRARVIDIWFRAALAARYAIQVRMELSIVQTISDILRDSSSQNRADTDW